MARDLIAHSGQAVVLVGEWQPPEVHALACWMNARLQAPVDYIAPPDLDRPARGSIADLVGDLRSPDPDSVLCVFGTNPAYDTPAALGVANAIGTLVSMRAVSIGQDARARSNAV